MMHAVATSASCSFQAGGVVSVVNSRGSVSQKPALQRMSVTSTSRGRRSCLKLRAQPTEKAEQYVDYEGTTSVFPAEACEDTGENCDVAGVFQEVRPTASSKPTTPPKRNPGPESEYQEYVDEKTVFPGEACDDLGGEFCDPKFQEGVFPEKVQGFKK